MVLFVKDSYLGIFSVRLRKKIFVIEYQISLINIKGIEQELKEKMLGS